MNAEQFAAHDWRIMYGNKEKFSVEFLAQRYMQIWNEACKAQQEICDGYLLAEHGIESTDRYSSPPFPGCQIPQSKTYAQRKENH